MFKGHEPEEYSDPSEGIPLAGFQTIHGQSIAPDPKEVWEWNPNWRFIKCINLEGEVIGCFPINIAMMLKFKTPIPSSRYLEWQ